MEWINDIVQDAQEALSVERCLLDCDLCAIHFCKPDKYN